MNGLTPLITLVTLILLTASGTAQYQLPNISLIATDWPLYVAKYCGRSCQNGSLVISHSLCIYPPCFPCTCDKHCRVSGTCCPNIAFDPHEKASYPFLEAEEGFPPTLYQSVRCIRLPSADAFFSTVTTCPNTWKDKSVRRLCESPNPKDMELVRPYSDRVTGIVFSNINCVICHGLEKYVTKTTGIYDPLSTQNQSMFIQGFSLQVSCRVYNQIFHISDPVEVFNVATALEGCSVTFKGLPSALTCLPALSAGDFYLAKADCRSKLDLAVSYLCSQLPPILALKSNTVYKNIFCDACNYEPYKENCTEINAPDEQVPPITLLFSPYALGPSTGMQPEYKWCDWLLYGETECPAPLCPPGKVLVDGTRCLSAIEDLGGLLYRAQMTILVKELKNVTQHELKLVATEIKSQLYWNINGSLELEYLIGLNSCMYVDYGTEFSFVVYINTSKSLPRDRFEKELVEFLINHHWIIYFPVFVVTDDGVYTLQYQSQVICVGKELCEIYHQKTTRGDCINELSMQSNGFNELQQQSGNAIDVTNSLTCPSVSISQELQAWAFNYTVALKIRFRNKDIFLPWNTKTQFAISKGKIQMCQDLLHELIMNYGDNSTYENQLDYFQHIVNIINYYLDIACLAVSCTFLVAAIFTYLLFPSLRSLPGLNTLCLCASLLTAHASLIMTSLIGGRRSLIEIHCLVQGMILHYCWLASFAWMNMCCLHMYCVFKGRYIGSDKRRFFWYCSYSFGCPCFVIISTIIITHFSTSGTSIGYNSVTCFLDTNVSALIAILGMLTPFCLSVSINSLLFFLTVKEILTVTKMQSDSRNGQGVLTYVKLSTVTGLFCFLSAIAVQFQVPILSIISSPLAALQGVFIFTSFIANKRVAKMYSKLLKQRNLHDKSTGHETITQTNVNQSLK